MKILFVHQSLQSFVQKDLDILRSKHEVRELCFAGRKNILLNIIPDLYHLIKGVLWCDMTFSWFGKLHAFFAVFFSEVLHKRSVVVSGGDDVACEPQIKYGMFVFWWKQWCPLFVFSHADLILCVSEFNKEETIKNAKADPRKVKLIYHGFSSQDFYRLPEINKNNTVITIGNITTDTLIIKGLRLFIESAKHLPDINFILVGPGYKALLDNLKNIAPQNLFIPGGVYGKHLVEICSKAKVYAQFSTHESFGCSIAEAMLCECVPVVSRNGAIPEVVGDTGFYVDELIPEKVAEKIKYALSLPEDYGVRARNRIIEKFPLSKRGQQILEAIETISNE